MTILTSQLTKLTVRALRELRDSITKKGKAAPKDSPKRQELRDDYSKVKEAIDKKEQYGKNVSAAEKVLDDKKPTKQKTSVRGAKPQDRIIKRRPNAFGEKDNLPDDEGSVLREDIPVYERGLRAEKARSSSAHEGGEPLTREGQAAASKFKSWLTSQTPPKMKELGSIYYRGKEAVKVSEKLIKEIKNTTDPKELSALNKRLDRSNKKAQKLRVKYQEVKDRGTRIGGGQKDESMRARVGKEKRVSLEDIEPLAKGRKGREQLGKRQLIKDADRKKLDAQVKKFMNYNLADRSGKVTKVPTGKQVTAGAPDDSEVKDLLNNIQAALATASKVPANPDRKSARAQKKFSEATVGQTTSNLRSGSLSALQKIIREEKKKSPRTWKNAVANLKNASVAVQKQAARLGIISKSAVKTPPKKTKPYKPTKPKVVRRGTKTVSLKEKPVKVKYEKYKSPPTPVRGEAQEQREAASKARNKKIKSVFNRINKLTPLIKKNGASEYQRRIANINKDIVALEIQRNERFRSDALPVFKKKGGKVLKTKPKRKVTTVKAVKPKRKVTTVKRKTTAPRKRAALRGYGKALRGF